MIHIRKPFQRLIDAQVYVEEYLQQYPPVGYGTAAKIIPHKKYVNGVMHNYYVQIERGESCG